jgi:hypothetical protein
MGERDSAFPKGLKPASFAGLDGAAEAVPYPKPSDDVYLGAQYSRCVR